MPTTPSHAVTRLGELLLARIERNSRSSLAEVWRAESGFSEPDTELVGHLIHHREELVLWMRAVLDDEPHGERWEQNPEAFLSGLLAPWLQERNQFLHLDAPAAPRGLRCLPDLGEAPRDAVCARYSPPLQLGALDLSSEALPEPVLDVGCGSDAAMVRYLRQRGVEAYGIDRFAPERLDGVVTRRHRKRRLA